MTFIFAIFGDNSQIEDNTKSYLNVGDTGRLYVEGLDVVGVATTKQALDDLSKAAIAKDSIGYAQIYLTGRAFQVPKYTKALILENTFTARKIRILEGEHITQTGWIPYEWIK